MSFLDEVRGLVTKAKHKEMTKTIVLDNQKKVKSAQLLIILKTTGVWESLVKKEANSGYTHLNLRVMLEEEDARKFSDHIETFGFMSYVNSLRDSENWEVVIDWKKR